MLLKRLLCKVTLSNPHLDMRILMMPRMPFGKVVSVLLWFLFLFFGAFGLSRSEMKRTEGPLGGCENDPRRDYGRK